MINSIQHIHQLAHTQRNDDDDDDLVPSNLWVNSEGVSLHKIPAPDVSPKKWPEILPWLMEDRILQPVEDTHFVVAQQDADKQLLVWAVAKQKMQEWIEVSHVNGIQPLSMYPDYLALEYEPGQWTLYQDGSRGIVRTGPVTGFAGDIEQIWQLVALECSRNPDLKVAASLPEHNVSENSDDIHSHEQSSYADNASVPVTVPDTLVPDAVTNDILAEQLVINHNRINWQFTETPPVKHLMTDAYKPVIASFDLKPWIPSFAVAGACILLVAIFVFFDMSQKQKQMLVMQDQMASLYQSFFRHSLNDSDDVIFKIREGIQTQELQYFAVNSGVMPLLQQLDAALSQCRCGLTSVKMSDSEIKIQVKQANKLKKRLNSIPGYELTWSDGSVSGADNGSNAGSDTLSTLTIKMIQNSQSTLMVKPKLSPTERFIMQNRETS